MKINAMTANDVILRIRQLENPETYFGRVATLYECSGYSLQESWLHTENERDALGLGPKYSTFGSYRKAKSVHHQQGGLIRLLNDIQPD